VTLLARLSGSAVSPHLAEMTDLLWPTGPVGPASSGTSDDRERSLVALPDARSPRLVVPRRPRAAAASAIRNYKASATGRGRLVVTAASLAARCGAVDLLPGRLVVRAGRGTDIEHHLSQVLGYDVLVALYLGPRRAVEKPVLQVLTERGETTAFAKLGTNALTRALIRSEVATLRRVGAADRSVLAIPRLLHAGAWHEHELIVQEAVIGGESTPPAVSLLAEAVRETAATGELSRHDWSASPYRVELRDRVRALAGSAHRAPLKEALTALDDRAGRHAMELGAAHGDWAPWNMTQRDGRLTVWDWEHWRAGVPVGFDAVHHDVARLVTVQSETPAVAFGQILDGVDSALTDRFAAHPRAALVTAYVVDLAARYVEDGEDVIGGTPLSRLGEWLVPVLQLCRSALRQEQVADVPS
jgi:hypothetical protein